MEQSVKLRLGLALLLTQIVLYYYSPKGGSSERPHDGTVSDFLCQVSSARNVCFSPIAALLDLCPLPKVQFAPEPPGSKADEPDDDDDDAETTRKHIDDTQEDFQKEKQETQVDEDDENAEAQVPKDEEKRLSGKEEKESSLIYHIIVVLLVVSVTASLADCFHERSRRKANPALAATSLRGEPTLNRRMSLADLTMQRHVRRESQAAFRPPGSRPVQEGFTGRRSSSQESPRTPIRQAPSKQRSCPAPLLKRLSVVDLQDVRDAQDGAWAERRRVRMIHRH